MTNLLESLHDSTTPRNDASPTLQSVDSSPDVAALLLTNVATIASNEMNHSVLQKPLLFDPSRMTLPSAACPGIVQGEVTCTCLHYDYGRNTPPPMISSDDENCMPESPVPVETSSSAGPVASRLYKPITPTSCPSALVPSNNDESTMLAPLTKRQKTHHLSQDGIVQHPRVIRQVLSKKFSFKHYKELEGFLIANREEYLRHSRLNYSVEQKKFNNKLTEELLELATEHGYVFDNFSFVMLRDKIRCYYKSYLQTLRKKKQQR